MDSGSINSYHSGVIVASDEGDSELYKLKTPLAHVRGMGISIREYTPFEIFMVALGFTQFTLQVIAAIVDITHTVRDETFVPGYVIVIAVIVLSIHLFIGPYLVIQRNKLTDIRTFKETQKAIKNEVDGIKATNDKLSVALEKLAERREELDRYRETLEHINSRFKKGDGENLLQMFEKDIKIKENTVEQYTFAAHATITRLLYDIMEYGFEANSTNDTTLFREEDLQRFLRRLREIDDLKIYEDRIREKMLNQPFSVCEHVVLHMYDQDKPENEWLVDNRILMKE